MIISIITININEFEGLKKTMTSVLDQTYSNIEYIVIDGGSTDGSKEYIETHQKSLAYWVSEPDTGIYNAMNKGIKKAKGDYLLFLNSGDSLYAPNVLEDSIKEMSDEYSIYYGDVMRVFDDFKIHKKYPKKLSFSFFMDSALAHQAVFIKRNLFSKYFLYNETFKILSDWEFIIYALCKENETYKYLNLIISNYDMNGVSSTEKGQLIMRKERDQTYKKFFPLFIDDYNRFINNPKTKFDPRIKNIENSKYVKNILKWTVIFLSYLAKAERKSARILIKGK